MAWKEATLNEAALNADSPAVRKIVDEVALEAVLKALKIGTVHSMRYV